MIRALGSAKRMPASPPHSRSEPIEAACPTQSVETFGLIDKVIEKRPEEPGLKAEPILKGVS